jgi:molybdopterin molybdotransferase
MGFLRQDDGEPLQVEAAQESILSQVPLLGAEVVGLREARTRVLREDVIAPFDVPERDNSAMDGYAVLAADTASATDESPAVLQVIEDIPAGAIARETVRPGTAARIMTGALVPAGADAVVQVEWTDGGDSEVRVRRGVKPGANIRSRGEDMRSGDAVLRAGTVLQSGEIGVLAAVQHRDVTVSRRPVVAILPTGDELVAIDEPRAAGKVVNSNAWAIAALVEEHGGIAVVHDIVRDDAESRPVHTTTCAMRSTRSAPRSTSRRLP